MATFLTGCLQLLQGIAIFTECYLVAKAKQKVLLSLTSEAANKSDRIGGGLAPGNPMAWVIGRGS